MRRQGTLEADVLVPAGQALVIGLAVILGGLGAGFPLALWQSWPVRWVLVGAFGLGLTSTAGAAIILVADHRRLLWAIEERLHVDLDGDHVAGDAADGDGERPFIYVRNVKRDKRQVSSSDFRAFLRGAYNGKGTTWRSWKGERLPSGRKVTRQQWEDYTGRLLRAGVAVREYETAPIDLVASYPEALETFAEVL
jgi:hypothetical protein